jgi:DUF1680 family protein
MRHVYDTRIYLRIGIYVSEATISINMQKKFGQKRNGYLVLTESTNHTHTYMFICVDI